MSEIVPEAVLHSATPVALVGTARARPGQADDLERTLRSVLVPTRAEAGCRVYELHHGPDGDLRFYEQWADGAALAAHLATPTMQEFLDRRHELLAGDLEVTFWTPLEPAPTPDEA